jgi:Flp pilus assembly protein TadG
MRCVNPWRRRRIPGCSWSRLRDDCRGNVAVIFAILMIPFLVAGGAAVDFTRGSMAKAQLQAALDAAVLAGVVAANDAEQSVGTGMFQGNFSGSPVNLTALTFTRNADGSVTGKASGALSTGILSAIGVRSISLQASATAKVGASRIKSVTFTPTKAKGWYAKDVFIFTRDASGTITQMTRAISYDYSFATQSSSISPPLHRASQTITLPAYATVGIMMRAWVNDSGTRTGTPVDSYSDDPNAAAFLRRKGDCAKNKETNEWEDGGDSDFQDLVDTMTCETENAAGGPYLVN